MNAYIKLLVRLRAIVLSVFTRMPGEAYKLKREKVEPTMNDFTMAIMCFRDEDRQLRLEHNGFFEQCIIAAGRILDTLRDLEYEEVEQRLHNLRRLVENAATAEARIAVFTTSEIFTYEGCRRAATKVVAEVDDKTFVSTGCLEQALDEGCEVFVISSRTELGEHDEWWRKLVKSENVLLSYRDDEDYLDSEDEEERRRNNLLKPWATLYTRLGLEYPRTSEGLLWWTAARSELQEYGVKLGYEFEKDALPTRPETREETRV
jgi:hypothetical protein